ncbi:lipopolysaccharide-induced tumor necrosis factor-alpha factor-like isoform X2 [Silurus meridionalis]|uniref:lipopolysaccharide-induced tumor necrosis factor-alpha factor-like isoform X2 n=1 Tax=Silurus meridionalis TaxID=175797 RepID=UPI001EEB62CF|nr:lipopolysaccharide-induced tumor necrosis factor-alpha factor-like isoform X2 [Silurus meridionalis]
MAATPANEKELERILVELQKLTLHREQLNNRLHMLAMLKEFRQNAGYSSEVCPTDEKDEYGKIEEDLKELSAKKLALQALKEELEGAGFSSTQIYDPSNNEIVTVDKPPSHPAPQIITDVEKLPRHPSHTLCPYCGQYIITEVSTEIGNTAWLVCLASTFICCIAGCCLIPFCVSSLKDVLHKCPKCRSHLYTRTTI